jgi:hypothetical protein
VKDIYPYTEFYARVGHQGVLSISPFMHRTQLRNGFSRLHLKVNVLPHALGWIGRLEFEFHVTKRTGGYYGMTVEPTLNASAG